MSRGMRSMSAFAWLRRRWLRSRPLVLTVVVAAAMTVCASALQNAAAAGSLTNIYVDLSLCQAADNANVTLSVSGAVGATELGGPVATISSYYVVVSYMSQANHGGWVALGGRGVSLPGYTPSQPPPAAPPLTFGATSMRASGVVYPGSGDPILGTTILPYARAGWSFGATVGLSSSTAALLADPTQVGNTLQVVFHAEGDHRVQGRSQSTQTIANPFQTPSGASGQCPGTPAGVRGPLSGALLNLAPTAAGPDVLGSAQSFTATLASDGKPIPNQQITFTVTGPNKQTGHATTNAQGIATFSYSGSAAGSDHVHASASSPGGTIYSSSTAVSWVSLANATLTLTPSNVANDVAGTTQVMSATLAAGGLPIANQSVSFTVTGANAKGGTATTNAKGVATFPYVGATTGADTVVATAAGGGSSVTSGPAHITWIAAVDANTTNPPAVATTPVQGNFYAEPASATSFVAAPTDTPAFGKSFPNVEFNPTAAMVNGEPPSGPTPNTRPFTDVTTDQAGGFAGTIVAQGNGAQAGVKTNAADLTTFDASFAANLNVGKAEDITFAITADDGFLFGVGGGATKVSGAVLGTAATTTPFHTYPLDAAYDQSGTGAPGHYLVTVHFPAAGSYPYELDYLSCCDHTLSLTLGIATSTTTPAPFNVSAGYADTTHPGGASSFPNPWAGAPNTTFVGDSAGPFDTGALRFDNTTTHPLTLDNVSVDIGSHHYTPAAEPQTVPASGSLILAGTAGNLDTSEAVSPGGTGTETYTVSTGYADCPVAPPTCSGSTVTNPSFPNPWYGAPGVQFVGDPAVANPAVSHDPDSSAIRLVNNGAMSLTINDVRVLGCSTSPIDLWGQAPNAYPYTVPAGGTIIFSSTAGDNFDGSDAGCTATTVAVTVNSVQTSFPDNSVNSGRGAIAGAPSFDESTPWTDDGSKAFGTTSNLPPAPGTAASGWSAFNFATGFPTGAIPNGPVVGPIGLAAVGTRMLAMDSPTGNLYSFGPGGGSAPANNLGLPTVPFILGLTVSKSGRLYGDVSDGPHAGDVYELNPTTGAIIRTVTNLGARDLGIVTDPISGDLMVNTTAALTRISHFEDAGPVMTSPYGPANSDGLTIAPDGTMYAANSNNIIEIAGTDKHQPAAVTTLTGLSQVDGMGLIAPPAGQPVTKLVGNRNNGTITEVDLSTNPPTLTDIYTGGTRGDFVTTGSDGCLYATQTDSIVKITAADGTCPFIPTVCTANPTVPMVNVTYNGKTTSYPDQALALTAGGKDGEICGNNESQPWTSLTAPGTTTVAPLPPAVALSLTPPVAKNDIINTSQTLTVAATDEAGHAAANVAITLAVSGANPRTLHGTTDASGIATFTYSGHTAGSDALSASAIVAGVASISNQANVTWVILTPGTPAPVISGPAPPFVSITAPTNGQTVTSPVAVTGIVNPPPTSPIATWNATEQLVGGGTPTTLASGSGNPPAQFATFDPTTLAFGTYALTVSATTAAGSSASAVTSVVVPSPGGGGGGTPAQAPPTIAITSPIDGSTVTQPTGVTATITPPSGETISSWNASYHTTASPAPVTLASGTGAPPATLATFDPTSLPNGSYTIVVQATASGGGTQTASVSAAVPAGPKIGRYVTTFNDLSIPVEGFNADVTRVYDSTDKTVGDFGVGWHLGASNYKVSVNAPLGVGGWSATPNQCSLFGCSYAFTSSTPHYVTVTFPDGHQEMFDFTPQGGFGPLFFFGQSAFSARSNTGTTSTLAVDPASDPGVQYGFDTNLYAGSTNAAYNPTRFVLTETNGTKLLLDESVGLVSETDLHGNTLSFDASGVHAVNGSGTNEPGIAFTRDGQGRITKVTGPTNQTITYVYTPAGDLQSVTDPVGNLTTFTYDMHHDLLKTTGPGGPLQTETYSAGGRMVSITDADGNTVTIANDVGASQQVLTDPNGQLTTILTYDSQGNVTGEQHIAGGVSRTTLSTYNLLGVPTSEVDALGNTTFNTFDARGDLTSTTDALGHTTTLAYNALGEATAVVDPMSHVTSMTYDSSGDALTFTNATGSTSHLTYDASGNLLTLKVPSGASYLVSYDAIGHPTKVVDPLGHATAATYDAGGNTLFRTDALNQTTDYLYDSAGRPISVKDPTGSSYLFAYDTQGFVQGITDPNGHATTYAHDPNGNVTQTGDALGSSVTENYDVDGHPTSLIDPDGRVRIGIYDAFGELTSATDPGGNNTTYGYDAAGRLVAQTTGLGTTSLHYDAAGDLIGETAGALSTAWGYDAAGLRTQMSDATGVTNSTYDAAGRLISVSSPQGAVTYGYDTNGRRASINFGGSKGFTYSYDGAGNATTITDWAGNAIALTYDANDRLMNTAYPNGVNTKTTYDGAGRVASIGAVGSAGPIGSFTYTRDHDGNPITLTSPTGTTHYGYDSLDRLVALSGPATVQQAFSYDRAGNITQTTNGTTTTAYSYDATSGLLTNVGTMAVTHDGDGNTTGIGTQRFTWDPLGRLGSTTGGNNASYTYNGDGILATNTNGAGTTPYLWDQVQGPVHTSDAPTLLSDGTTAYIPGPNGPLAQTNLASGALSADVTDALGSVSAVVSGSGTTTASATYSPYGNATDSGPRGALGFAGGLQPSSGLLYLQARWMDSALGSFLSPDAVQPNAFGTAGYNQYVYGADDPLVNTDPSGTNIGDTAGDYDQRAVYAGQTLTPGVSNVSTTYRVYKAVSKTGRCYFGITKQRLGKRWYQHNRPSNNWPNVQGKQFDTFEEIVVNLKASLNVNDPKDKARVLEQVLIQAGGGPTGPGGSGLMNVIESVAPGGDLWKVVPHLVGGPLDLSAILDGASAFQTVAAAVAGC